MSKLSQFYVNDNVGDRRSSQDFIASAISEGVYDDGYKFYVRTGTFVLNPPDRVKNDDATMRKYGMISAQQHVSHKMAVSPRLGATDNGIVYANTWYIASCGSHQDRSGGGYYSSLVMRSQDEFATYKFTDIFPYVYQHVTIANGIPFIFSSGISLGSANVAIARTNVLKSHDGGETWEPLIPDDTGYFQYKTTQVTYLNSTYFIVCDKGIYYSTDPYANTGTWKSLGGRFTRRGSSAFTAGEFGNINDATVSINAVTPRSIDWDGTRYGVLVNDFLVDTGTENNASVVLTNTELSPFGWERATLPDSRDRGIRIKYVNDKWFVMYGTVGDYGLHYSTTGTSYSQTTNLGTVTPGNVGVYDILWDSANSRYWAATSNGVYQSADGITFTQVANTGQPTSAITTSVATITILNNVVYAANNGNGFFRSANSNTMWAQSQVADRHIGKRVANANGKVFCFGGDWWYATTNWGTPGFFGAIRTVNEGYNGAFTDKLAIPPIRSFAVDTAANCMFIAANTVIIKYNATTGYYTNYFPPTQANQVLKTANNLYTIGNRFTADFVTWNTPTGFTGNVHEMVITDNNMIVCATSTVNAVYSVTNATTWVNTSVGDSSTDFIAYGNGVLVLGGSLGTNSQNVKVSYNGINWFGANTSHLSPVPRFSCVTYVDKNDQFLLGCYGASSPLATFPHHNQATGDWIQASGAAGWGGNCDYVVFCTEDLNTPNTIIFSIITHDKQEGVSHRFSEELGTRINLVNSVYHTGWTAQANDLIFISGSTASVTSFSFGTPNTYLSVKYSSTISNFLSQSISTGHTYSQYNTGTRFNAPWRNMTMKSCTEWDGKYWLPPTTQLYGWSEFKRDMIYIPGDGTEFVRIY